MILERKNPSVNVISIFLKLIKIFGANALKKKKSSLAIFMEFAKSLLCECYFPLFTFHCVIFLHISVNVYGYGFIVLCFGSSDLNIDTFSSKVDVEIILV